MSTRNAQRGIFRDPIRDDLPACARCSNMCPRFRQSVVLLLVRLHLRTSVSDPVLPETPSIYNSGRYRHISLHPGVTVTKLQQQRAGNVQLGCAHKGEHLVLVPGCDKGPGTCLVSMLMCSLQ
jgi:hypothetical protein